MKRTLLLCSALAAIVLSSNTGCKKMHLGKKAEPTPAPAEAATPVPTPVAVATPPPVQAGRVSNRNAKVIALCYHNIEDKKTGALTISVEDFEKEMQQLKDNGFTVISMQDFLAWRRGEKAIPEKAALITIDDGWVSAYDNAWPILKKFNYPFTLFIYIDYVNTGGKSMTWDQLAEMRDAGVDIESHTFSHSDLKKPGILVDKTTAARVAKDVAALGLDGWLHKEVVGSKQALEQKLGIKVSVFAYPFGISNEKVRQVVKEAGYEAAFTVYGQQLRYGAAYDQLGRYAIDSKNLKNWDDAIKMIGGGAGPTDSGPDDAQLAAASMVTIPAQGETIGNAKPLIKANLETMGQLDAGSVKMRISGVGPVPAKYDEATHTVSYQVTQPLTAKSYSVIISATAQGRKLEAKWDFNYDATGKNVGPAPEQPLPPR